MQVEVGEDVPDVLTQMGEKWEFQDRSLPSACSGLFASMGHLSTAPGQTAPCLISINPQFC